MGLDGFFKVYGKWFIWVLVYIQSGHETGFNAIETERKILIHSSSKKKKKLELPHVYG